MEQVRVVAWLNRAAVLALAVVLALHGWLTCRWFDRDHPLSRLIDDEPVLGGVHALNLYQGWVGSRALREQGSSFCYDPNFHAGYPKTALFNSGSGPAECFQWLGTRFQDRAGEEPLRPAAYKLGFGCCWSLVPLLMWLAALAAGFGAWPSCLCACLSVLVLNTDAGQSAAQNGRIDWVLAAALGSAGLGGLLRFHAQPGLSSMLFAAISLAGVVFTQPLVFVGLLPAAVLYYLLAAGKHGPAWHLGLALVLAAGPLLHWRAIHDLVEHGWLLTEQPAADRSPESPLMRTWEDVSVGLRWGELPVPVLLVVGGLIGCGVWFASRRGLPAAVLAMTLLIFTAANAFGEALEILPGFDRDRVLLCAMLIASLPLADGIGELFAGLGRWLGSPVRAGLVIVLCIAAIVAAARDTLEAAARRCLSATPLVVGVPDEVRQAASELREHTNETARILWEETPETEAWSPLLPAWTNRGYIGGLGPAARIEHASIRLSEGVLAGKPIENWRAAELAEFCRLFNIGWVVCRSEAARARLLTLNGAKPTLDLPTGHQVFTLDRRPAYVLSGSAESIHWDHRGLTLTGVQPVDGLIDLSFHYHAHLVPSNDCITVTRLDHGFSAVPLLRLRLSRPVSRLTLSWQD